MPVSDGFVLGLAIGLTVVVVVVVLLVWMTWLASKAAAKAEAIILALDDARDNTAALWNVDTTNRTVTRIVTAATAAREYLAEQGARS